MIRAVLSSADISQPDFVVKVGEDQRTVLLHVTDPVTTLFKDGRQLSVRDVFAEQLQYRVTYRKNKSSGKVSSTSPCFYFVGEP